MLAEVVAIKQGLGDGFGLGPKGEGAVGHAGDGFEDDGVVRGLVRSAAPDEGGVAGDEAGGNSEGVDGEGVGSAPTGVGAHVTACIGGVGGVAWNGLGLDGAGGGGTEEVDDGEAGLMHVAAADGVVRERFGTGNRAVEVVRVCGAEGGDGEAGLGEGGRELGVGVDDGADGGELAIEQGVGVEIGGWLERALDEFAVEVGHHHVFRPEIVVVDAGGLDDDEALLAVDAGGVAEGIEDEASFYEFEVGFEDFFAKLLEEHGHLSLIWYGGTSPGEVVQNLRKRRLRSGPLAGSTD